MSQMMRVEFHSIIEIGLLGIIGGAIVRHLSWLCGVTPSRRIQIPLQRSFNFKITVFGDVLCTIVDTKQ
jgi:hypothetical protein